MKISNLQHWQVNIDNDHIVWTMLDKKNASTNSLDNTVLSELESLIETLEKQSDLKGIVIGSAKTSGFIAGADIEKFKNLDNPAYAADFIHQGQKVFSRLAAVKIPTVAMIQGFCLGGGMELALACRYRVAENGPKTKLGLPEVMLGLHPGWGGSVRLPRLIGALQAMELILTGRTVSASAAAKMGFVDAAVPLRMLKRAVQSIIMNPPPVHKASLFQSMTNHALVRPLLGKQFRRKLRQKIRDDHYPAPYAVLHCWEKYGVSENALHEEAESLVKIVQTATAKNLIRVFFLQDRLKGLAKGFSFHPQHVHVVGAGTMGGDIAAWCALRGIKVTLQDREAKFIAPAIQRAYQLYKKKFKTPREIQVAMDRLIPDPHANGVPTAADVIIEAIFENLEAKQTLFKVLEEHAKTTALLATNTSSIPLDEIVRVLKKHDRLVGIHFFNPVAKMQLVEIVQGDRTAQSAVEHAMAFVRTLDRLPLPVKSKPGFLVNRMLMPYLMEAVILIEEGVPMRAIDKAAKDFGMPMGPVELADAVGLDVCLAVAEKLAQHFGGQVPQIVRQKVEQKKLGIKSGEGFYTYKKGKLQKPASTLTAAPEDLTDRLILRMINEAVACVQEGVVADADLLDAGMIFGTGFAPFRGGPMEYVRTEGKDKVLERLKALHTRLGDRFKPNAGWEKIS